MPRLRVLREIRVHTEETRHAASLPTIVESPWLSEFTMLKEFTHEEIMLGISCPDNFPELTSAASPRRCHPRALSAHLHSQPAGRDLLRGRGHRCAANEAGYDDYAQRGGDQVHLRHDREPQG